MIGQRTSNKVERPARAANNLIIQIAVHEKTTGLCNGAHLIKPAILIPAPALVEIRICNKKCREDDEFNLSLGWMARKKGLGAARFTSGALRRPDLRASLFGAA